MLILCYCFVKYEVFNRNNIKKKRILFKILYEDVFL